MTPSPALVRLATLAVAAATPAATQAAAPATPTAPAAWRCGVVAADHPAASEAGVEMLRRGGNAVDAAVAASFCLSVVRPYSCGIGGGGFMLIHEPGPPPRSVAIDYRERAPAAVGPGHFAGLGDSLASRYSGHAVCVPGTAAGLLLALERHGTLDRATVLAPAIRAAEGGFAADAHYLKVARDAVAWFAEDPSRRLRHRFVWERFLRSGAIAEGDSIRLPEQAEALRLIARDGAAAVHGGPIGRAILAAVTAAGGAMTEADLLAYAPTAVAPLAGSFRGRTILAMPPPSSGGVATLEVLEILERYERRRGIRLEDLGPDSPAYVHLVVEAMKHAFADRARWFGDPERVEVPVARLLDPAYLDRLAAGIDPERTREPAAYGSSPAPPDDGGTSHLSVIDRHGNAVSCTETINLAFGSRLAVEPFGFLLNNDMDDFTTVRGRPNAFSLQQSERNLPGPGKRPLSSMSPTIVLDPAGQVELIAGASGGPRIITSVVESLLAVLVFGRPAAAAVASPRFHHQWWPDVLALEPGGFPPAFEAELRARGHVVGPAEDVGVVQMVVRAGGGAYSGACDPRKGGRPAGLEPVGAGDGP